MIIYSGTKTDFMNEVEEDTIAYSIRDNILEKMHRKTGEAEFRSWINSLEYMYKVLNDNDIPKEQKKVKHSIFCGNWHTYTIPESIIQSLVSFMDVIFIIVAIKSKSK